MLEGGREREGEREREKVIPLLISQEEVVRNKQRSSCFLVARRIGTKLLRSVV